MIYTITLNPALDRDIWIEKVSHDDTNRIQKEERFAAGKGIDVSQVLTTFSLDSFIPCKRKISTLDLKYATG